MVQIQAGKYAPDVSEDHFVFLLVVAGEGLVLGTGVESSGPESESEDSATLGCDCLLSSSDTGPRLSSSMQGGEGGLILRWNGGSNTLA